MSLAVARFQEPRPPLVLASTSPRRSALLAAAGFRFEVLDPGPDGPGNHAEPGRRVLQHAAFKALAGARLRPGRWLVAADTLVWCRGRFLPKPADAGEARDMLQWLAETEHQVWTGVCVVDPDGRLRQRADRAEVRFRPIPAAELEAYLQGSEWQDKAGAYAIQGWAGAWTELLSGSLDTVIGLDPNTVADLIVAPTAADLSEST